MGKWSVCFYFAHDMHFNSFQENLKDSGDRPDIKATEETKHTGCTSQRTPLTARQSFVLYSSQRV